MNKQKVCFVCCTNDRMYERECRLYLEHLHVPDGMEIEIKMIHGARSMTSGYNHAMGESDAKYKVYLHQDVFILNKEFIADMLQIFANEKVGMFGVVGAVGLPENGIVYTYWNRGKLKTCDSYAAFEINVQVSKEEKKMPIDAVDGLLIATQYDLPWREDLFDGWDFYDASQAIEFRKAGYEVRVPEQKEAWCFHDDGYQNLHQYDRYRSIFLQEYGEYLNSDNWDQKLNFYPEQWELTQELKKQLLKLFESGMYDELHSILEESYERLSRDTDISVLRNMLEIWWEEQRVERINCFLEKGATWEEMRNKYYQYKFWMHEMEFGIGDGERKMMDEIKQDLISPEAIFCFLVHNTLSKQKLLLRFAKLYYEIGNIKIETLFRNAAENWKAKEQEMKLKVILIVHNQKNLLQEELQILEIYGGISKKDIIIVDNASSDGLKERLAQQNDFKYMFCEDEIQSYSVILNSVIRKFGIREDFLVLTPDYIILPGAIEQMYQTLHSQQDIGAVSATVLHCGLEQIKDYSSAIEYVKRQQGKRMPDAQRMGLPFGAVMVKSEMRVDLEAFDARLILPHSCMMDFLLRGILENYRLVECKEAFLYKIVADGTEYTDKYGEDVDQPVLKEKWGMNYFNDTFNGNLICLIDRASEETFDVLEIGCDCGANLLEVKNRYPNVRLYGMELNPRAAEIAAHNVQVQVGNIEDKTLRFEEIHFDYIIFGDVLEHLRDPAGTIRYCKSLLKEDGRIIACIPNLMHYSVMRQLIDGDFTYEDKGLLDRSHIHFFTYNEIKRMFEQEGYEIEVIVNSLSRISLQEEREFIAKLVCMSNGAESFMFQTFQYIVSAKAKKKAQH